MKKILLFSMLVIVLIGQAKNSFDNYYIDSDVEDAVYLAKNLNPQNNTTIFHLFSHGEPGELLINGKWLNASEIHRFLKKKISQRDTEKVYLYGCNFAKGEKGMQAVAFLERTLGVQVAASTNVTGKNGDWLLEVGNIALNDMENYDEALQCPSGPTDDCDGDGVSNNVDIDDDNDGILDVNENLSYTIFGDASDLGSQLIQLTPGGATVVTGGVYFNNRINFENDFDFSFEVNLGSNDSGYDGIAFLFHNDPAGFSAIGSGGAGFGASGVQNGLYLEIDTYQNTFLPVSQEPVQDHVHFVDSDNNSILTTIPYSLGNIENGLFYSVRIRWNAGAQTLTAFFNNVNVSELSGVDVINSYFGGASEVVFAVTAAAGNDGVGKSNQHLLQISEGFLESFDFDNDGVSNKLDLDSDNDGIPDNVEAQATASYTKPGAFSDNDGDGLNDVYDADNTDTSIAASVGLTPVNTDASFTNNDTTPDYLDLDSDGDSLFDIDEAGIHTTVNDSDSDGATNNPVGNNGLEDGNGVEASDDYSDVNALSFDDATDTFLLARSMSATDLNFRFEPSVLSTTEVNIEGFKLYPNPLASDQQLHITTQNNNYKQISLYNMAGTMVYQAILSPFESANLAGVKSGIYVIVVEENGLLARKKLIVE